MKIRSLVLSAVAVTMCAIAAHAQLQISVISFDKAGTPISDTCKQEVNIFLHVAASYPRPAHWHVVVVCDDPAWDALMNRIQKANAFHLAATDIDNQYGLTDIDHNYTLLRGHTLLYTPMWCPPDRVISHELSHVLLHSRQEDVVDAQALKWMKDNKQAPGSLVAGLQPMEWVVSAPAVDAK